MEKKKIAEAVAVCILFLFLAAYVESTDYLLDADGRIARAKPGEGSSDVNLTLSAEGLFQEYEYPLTVCEEELTKEAAGEYLLLAKKEIDERFFAEGEDADHVTKKVRMEERYVEGLVRAEWSLDSYRVIEPDGSVVEEAVSETGELVNATVSLACGGCRENYTFGFMVYPREKSEEEALLAAIDKQLEAQQEAKGERYLRLPEEVNGYRLHWEETRKHLVWKVLAFEIAILILLYFVKKEREREREREKKAQMRLDYPEVVSKLLILLGAGMPLRQAWDSISTKYSDKRKKKGLQERYVYEEMLIASHEIAGGVSEARAYQNFGERTNLGSYNRLVRILVQNLQTGSRGLCRLLEQESQLAFKEREALAKKLGEEAGTKLLLPMMLMLVIVIAIIMVPAMLSFNI